jgi:hypothetical protein
MIDLTSFCQFLLMFVCGAADPKPGTKRIYNEYGLSCDKMNFGYYDPSGNRQSKTAVSSAAKITPAAPSTGGSSTFAVPSRNMGKDGCRRCFLF